MEVRKATGRGKNRFKIRNVSADERCTRATLDYLRTIRAGRREGPRGSRETLQSEGGKGRRKDKGSREGEAGKWRCRRCGQGIRETPILLFFFSLPFLAVPCSPSLFACSFNYCLFIRASKWG